MSEQNDSWYGEFGAETPEDFKSWVSEKQYADPQTALNAHWNLEKLMGADKAGRTVVLPKDENDAEGLSAFRSKLGVPDSADGYELPVGEGASEAFAKTASTWFHEAGIPKEAAQGLTAKWNAHFTQLLKEAEDNDRLTSEKALNALKDEWGDAFDERSELGRRGLQAYGTKAGLDEHDIKALEQSIGTSKMLKMFHALGESTKEADFTSGDRTGFTMTPAEAQSKLDAARKQRMAGDMTQDEFMAIEDKYGPVAAKAAA